MFLALLGAIAAVLMASTALSLKKTRDPLCPIAVFAPMLAYVFVFRPWVLHVNGVLGEFPAITPDQWCHASWNHLFGVAAFCVGCASTGKLQRLGRELHVSSTAFSASVRNRLTWMSIILGITASAAFWSMVNQRGGFAELFSVSKAYLYSSSGYVKDLPLFVFPAILFYALALQGRPIGVPQVVLLLAIASPQIIMATLGGRRGPVFLVATTLAFFFCIVKRKLPSFRTVIVGVLILGLFMLFLYTNRRFIYLGSEERVRFDLVWDEVFTSGTSAALTSRTDNEYVLSTSLILLSDRYRHFWGSRLFVQMLIRPIPKQIWPTKYADMGFGWMETQPGTFGFSYGEWLEAVSFAPHRGSSVNFVGDAYLEFGIFGALVCYGIGRLYSACWRRWVARGGLWTLVYFVLLSLSVYLPAQSIQAWAQRSLLILLPVTVVWCYLISNRTRYSARQESLPVRPANGPRASSNILLSHESRAR